jgi:ferritin-like metal-binding protein YciE
VGKNFYAGYRFFIVELDGQPGRQCSRLAYWHRIFTPLGNVGAMLESVKRNMRRAGRGLANSGQALEKLFLSALMEIYAAEKILEKAIPKMIRACTTEELQLAFDEQVAATHKQIGKIEKVFGLLDKNATDKRCDAMEGLVKELEHVIEETRDGSKTRDVAIIMAARKVEHYEIASYASLVRLARTIGRNDVAMILEEILGEAREADMMFTGIGENNINAEADLET